MASSVALNKTHSNNLFFIGSVAVLELTGVRFGDAGKLVSPLFRPANGSCKVCFIIILL